MSSPESVKMKTLNVMYLKKAVIDSRQIQFAKLVTSFLPCNEKMTIFDLVNHEYKSVIHIIVS